jgi:hypothetical protein
MLTRGKRMTALSPIKDIVADIRAGRMVVLVDEEDRENEGDLVLAAEYVTPEAINFMAKHGRGLICLTLTEARCRQLNLPLMVRDNRSPHGTAFTSPSRPPRASPPASRPTTAPAPCRRRWPSAPSPPTSSSPATSSR